MRVPLAIVFFSFMAAAAADPAVTAPTDAAPSLPLRARLNDEAIARAVRDTLAESPSKMGTPGTGPLRADPYADFGRKFEDARVPGCLRPDAFKHAPPHIGPIGIGGIYALPFLAAAAIRGKCN